MVDSKSRTRKARPALGRRRLLAFGPPPLIEGEYPADYNDLFAGICAAVKPRDILEEIWINDYLDLEWEIIRNRRLKTKLMSIKRYEAFEQLCRSIDNLEEYFPNLDEEKLKQRLIDWYDQEPYTLKKEINDTFASAGLTMDAVTAMVLLENLDAIVRIDNMIAMAEARRNSALRELDRHRATLGQALRRAVEQVEDAEFDMIETKPADEARPA
jgi:hypothetical protein